MSRFIGSAAEKLAHENACAWVALAVLNKPIMKKITAARASPTPVRTTLGQSGFDFKLHTPGEV
jgi:hypothetical protein